MITVDNGS